MVWFSCTNTTTCATAAATTTACTAQGNPESEHQPNSSAIRGAVWLRWHTSAAYSGATALVPAGGHRRSGLPPTGVLRIWRWRSTASGRPVGQSRYRTRRRRSAACRWRSGQEEQLPTLPAKNRGGGQQRHQQGVESDPVSRSPTSSAPRRCWAATPRGRRSGGSTRPNRRSSRSSRLINSPRCAGGIAAICSSFSSNEVVG